MRALWLLSAFALACSPGSLEERLPGRYEGRTQARSALLDLRGDGSLTLAQSAPGDSSALLTGRWTASRDTVFLQVGDAEPYLNYRGVLRGDSLALSTASGPLDEPLVRIR